MTSPIIEYISLKAPTLIDLFYRGFDDRPPLTLSWYFWIMSGGLMGNGQKRFEANVLAFGKN